MHNVQYENTHSLATEPCVCVCLFFSLLFRCRCCSPFSLACDVVLGVPVPVPLFDLNVSANAFSTEDAICSATLQRPTREWLRKTFSVAITLRRPWIPWSEVCRHQNTRRKVEKLFSTPWERVLDSIISQHFRLDCLAIGTYAVMWYARWIRLAISTMKHFNFFFRFHMIFIQFVRL